MHSGKRPLNFSNLTQTTVRSPKSLQNNQDNETTIDAIYIYRKGAAAWLKRHIECLSSVGFPKYSHLFWISRPRTLWNIVIITKGQKMIVHTVSMLVIVYTYTCIDTYTYISIYTWIQYPIDFHHMISSHASLPTFISRKPWGCWAPRTGKMSANLRKNAWTCQGASFFAEFYYDSADAGFFLKNNIQGNSMHRMATPSHKNGWLLTPHQVIQSHIVNILCLWICGQNSTHVLFQYSTHYTTYQRLPFGHLVMHPTSPWDRWRSWTLFGSLQKWLW